MREKWEVERDMLYLLATASRNLCDILHEEAASQDLQIEAESYLEYLRSMEGKKKEEDGASLPVKRCLPKGYLTKLSLSMYKYYILII